MAVLAGGLAFVVVAATASWMLGRQHALGGLSFTDVSASAAARAMQDDHFFADYGDKILVVHGTVENVQGHGGSREISMRTDTQFGLTCTVTALSEVGQPAAGTVISVVAPGGAALREPSSVNLTDCRIMSAR